MNLIYPPVFEPSPIPHRRGSQPPLLTECRRAVFWPGPATPLGLPSFVGWPDSLLVARQVRRAHCPPRPTLGPQFGQGWLTYLEPTSWRGTCKWRRQTIAQHRRPRCVWRWARGRKDQPPATAANRCPAALTALLGPVLFVRRLSGVKSRCKGHLQRRIQSKADPAGPRHRAKFGYRLAITADDDQLPPFLDRRDELREPRLGLMHVDSCHVS